VEFRLFRPIPEKAVLHAFPESPDHGLGRWEVHVGHPEGQDVRRELVPLVALGAAAVDDAVEIVGHGMARIVEDSVPGQACAKGLTRAAKMGIREWLPQRGRSLISPVVEEICT
jgi:hypothetical protein